VALASSRPEPTLSVHQPTDRPHVRVRARLIAYSIATHPGARRHQPSRRRPAVTATADASAACHDLGCQSAPGPRPAHRGLCARSRRICHRGAASTGGTPRRPFVAALRCAIESPTPEPSTGCPPPRAAPIPRPLRRFAPLGTVQRRPAPAPGDTPFRPPSPRSAARGACNAPPQPLPNQRLAPRTATPAPGTTSMLPATTGTHSGRRLAPAQGQPSPLDRCRHRWPVTQRNQRTMAPRNVTPQSRIALRVGAAKLSRTSRANHVHR
jgi:hypothetical protein